MNPGQKKSNYWEKNEETKTCLIENFTVPVDLIVKLKEIKKLDKYLDLAIELRKLQEIKVTVVLVILGAQGTILKSLEELEIQGRIKIPKQQPIENTKMHAVI